MEPRALETLWSHASPPTPDIHYMAADVISGCPAGSCAEEANADSEVPGDENNLDAPLLEALPHATSCRVSCRAGHPLYRALCKCLRRPRKIAAPRSGGVVGDGGPGRVRWRSSWVLPVLLGSSLQSCLSTCPCVEAVHDIRGLHHCALVGGSSRVAVEACVYEGAWQNCGSRKYKVPYYTKNPKMAIILTTIHELET